MARDLKQNTAVIIAVGPLAADTDGITLISDATVTDIDCGIIKAGTAGAALTLTSSTGVNDMAPVANNPGYYTLELTSSNVNTVGPLRITMNDSDVFVPIWEDFNVINSAEWTRRYS